MNGIYGRHKNIEALTFEGWKGADIVTLITLMASAMNNMNSSGAFLKKERKTC